MKVLFCAFFTFCFFTVFISCAQKSPVFLEKKINGISYVASRSEIQQTHIDPLLSVYANYAAVMPFGFIKNLEHPEIIYNQDRQWFGETAKGVAQCIEMLHKNNIQVMMKPQIWVWRGEYTGHLKMASEEDWKLLEVSYRSFILEYARTAETSKADIFCIGTELEQFIKERPEYWNSLISEIRKVYSGKLTYAANWDEYTRVPFWNLLDYIGVDAYFPVSESKTPSVAEVRKGWQRWKNEMKSLSEKENKEIIFTEYGYRSVDFSGKEPWKSDREMNSVNFEAQNYTTQALFDEIWTEDWFAGGFLWKWHVDPKAGESENAHFTPQNKPVEEIVRKHYKKYE